MKKLFIVIAMLLIAGCSTIPENSIIISCPKDDSINMTLPYSEERFKEIQKKGEGWIAQFECRKDTK